MLVFLTAHYKNLNKAPRPRQTPLFAKLPNTDNSAECNLI